MAPVFDEDKDQSVGSAAIVHLTDSSGGVAANTIAAIGASYSQTEVANAVASNAAKINAILTALEAAGILALD